MITKLWKAFTAWHNKAHVTVHARENPTVITPDEREANRLRSLHEQRAKLNEAETTQALANLKRLSIKSPKPDCQTCGGVGSVKFYSPLRGTEYYERCNDCFGGEQ